jgi:hypothetical protein
MKKDCKEIAELLVDYADGQSQAGDVKEVSEHLQICGNCQNTLKVLQKSLCLANEVWKEGLEEMRAIQIPTKVKIRKINWVRYAAIAAAILIAAAGLVIRHQFIPHTEKETTFAEIEHRITDEGNAARLLAAAEMLTKYPDAEFVSKQEYRYIVERYPQTQAAAKAKSLMK